MNKSKNHPTIAALILAAGSGKRMNANINKVWLSLNGKSLLEHTLDTFQGSGLFDLIVVTANQNELDHFQEFITAKKFEIPVWITAGGEERQNSVAKGLSFLDALPEWQEGSFSHQRFIAIHDAARALVTQEILWEAVSAGKKFDAASVGVPVKDTIKQLDSEGFVVNTPDRAKLWAVQTPQVFKYELINECHRKVQGLDRVFSDDCSVLEYFGYPVKMVQGSYENIKITTPEDILLAEAILRRRVNADRTRL